MSLLPEYIPEHNRTRFAGEVVDLKLLCPLDDFRIISARLTESSEVAFDVRHENRYATRTKIFRERLQRYRFSGPCGACNQAVAVRHLRQQKNRLFRLRDEDWFGHDAELSCPRHRHCPAPNAKSGSVQIRLREWKGVLDQFDPRCGAPS